MEQNNKIPENRDNNRKILEGIQTLRGIFSDIGHPYTATVIGGVKYGPDDETLGEGEVDGGSFTTAREEDEVTESVPLPGGDIEYFTE